VPKAIGATSEDHEFNPLYHIKKKLTPEELENLPPKTDNLHDDEDATIERKVVRNITELWLRMTPDKEAFSRDIIKCITEGRSAI